MLLKRRGDSKGAENFWDREPTLHTDESICSTALGSTRHYGPFTVEETEVPGG